MAFWGEFVTLYLVSFLSYYFLEINFVLCYIFFVHNEYLITYPSIFV